MCEEFATRDVGEQHVDVETVLERGKEIDNERVSHAREDVPVPLGIDVLHLA